MKSISTDTHRARRIHASLLLAVLLYCCLLFMDEERVRSRKEEAYENLCTDLGKLLDKLRDLKIEINNRKLISTEATNSKIDGLIQIVSSAQQYLNEKIPDKKIKKNINIVPELQQAQKYLSRILTKKSHYSSEELSTVLDQVEEIWRQVQVKIREAVLSAHH